MHAPSTFWGGLFDSLVGIQCHIYKTLKINDVQQPFLFENVQLQLPQLENVQPPQFENVHQPAEVDATTSN